MRDCWERNPEKRPDIDMIIKRLAQNPPQFAINRLKGSPGEMKNAENCFSPSTAQHGTARHGTARHGTARHGTARHGTARHGTARHGTARHSTVQLEFYETETSCICFARFLQNCLTV